MKHKFSFLIINWYEQNKRALPWRETKDPYIIWLSEIILQQTRVEQGTPYFNRFINKYPTIIDLANAPIDDVLKLWQGLGYYSRARNLHETAIYIKLNYNGIFPSNYSEIIALKGIGRYTASAIASFAFNKPYPVVDGNVSRVISRLFGVFFPIDTEEGRKKIYEMANELINKNNPSSFNQAMMEFGALQCTPIKPICDSCIFFNDCYSFKHNCIEELPLKKNKTKQKERFFNYLVFKIIEKNNTYIYLQKRTENDIWKGLYDFPLIETSETNDFQQLILDNHWGIIIDDQKFKLIDVSKTYKHQLTHQRINAQFFSILIYSTLKTKISQKYNLINITDFKKYAIPKLIENYFNESTKKPQLL